jgi:hypothetical protein
MGGFRDFRNPTIGLSIIGTRKNIEAPALLVQHLWLVLAGQYLFVLKQIITDKWAGIPIVLSNTSKQLWGHISIIQYI